MADNSISVNNQHESASKLEHEYFGVWKAPHARIIDRSGKKRLPIGYADFVSAMRIGTLVDKTMLIADVLDSGYAATLFCRPRRFGKTLNMTMMRAFFEATEAGGLTTSNAREVFAGTDIWEANEGSYRTSQGTHPVVHLSFSTAKKTCWADTLAEIRGLVADEYLRHAYLREEGTPLVPEDVNYFNAIAGNTATDADFARSLAALCRMLFLYHGSGVVVLIDEYDAPVMSGHTYGYYDAVVNFLKGWLTGALKDGGASVAFTCLTGVQRISKESVFSDLNNLKVLTPLDDASDERFGFTDAEVEALANYLNHPKSMDEARTWYDGYRFGNVDVYNPWSVTNYFNEGCTPGAYWGNTSGNSVVGELVTQADADTLGDIYALLEPGGVVEEPLDLTVAFPEIGVRGSAIWSMLYLAGYLTTNDTDDPSDSVRLRPLRIPNREVARLFRNEIIGRFRTQAGGVRRLATLQQALVTGDASQFESELAVIVERTSYLDLTSELPCHMFMMGLLFGVPGYLDPLSNREAGVGRYDIQLQPDAEAKGAAAGNPRPLITLELKYVSPANVLGSPADKGTGLHVRAEAALRQIAEKGYDSKLPATAQGRVRWGVVFCGKQVAVACEHL